MPRTRLRRPLRRCLGLALALALVSVAAPAHADNVESDVEVSGGDRTRTITTAESTTVNYLVRPTGRGGGGPTCDPATGSPAVITVVAGPAVTVTPNPLTITSCDTAYPVTLTAATPGSYPVSVKVHDPDGDYNISNGSFRLVVVPAAPANTAPQVDVDGVTDGADYEHGSVPEAVCNVSDAEDGARSFAADLTTVTGDHAALGVGTQTASCSYTDTAGLTTAASATYSIVDTQAPILTVPGDLSVEAEGPAGSVVQWEATASDTVDPHPVVDCTGGASGDTYPLGRTTLSCTATDALGNSDTAEFTVDVVDRTVPTLTLPGDLTVEATGPGGATVDYVAEGSDTVDGALAPRCVPASGSVFPRTTTTVECAVTDAGENVTRGSFDVTVVDTTAPEVTVPTDMVVEAAGPDGAVVDYAAAARDVVDGELGAACAPASGVTFAIGSAKVTCSSTDSAGNTGFGAFMVTVRDTTAPTLTLPDPITVEATGPAGADVDFSATATDLVDGMVPVVCTPESGATFGLGEHTAECEAVDAAGNVARGSVEVLVQDTTAPSLQVPVEDVVAEATGPDGAVVEYAVSAADTVDTDVVVQCGPASGARFALGSHRVECSATDDAGNATTAEFVVVVRDTTAPSITVTEVHPTEAVGPDGAPVSFDATADDLVDGAVAVRCTPPSDSTFALGDTDVSCVAEDSRGNVAEHEFTVTVQDTTAPMLTVPAEMIREATGPQGAQVDFGNEVSAYDVVDGSRPVACDPGSGSRFALGQSTVSCSASDTRENRSEGSFTVKVVDTTAPELALPAGVTVEATGPGGAVVDLAAQVSAFDLVDGDVEVRCAPASGTTFALGTTTVGCEATDAAGNTSSGSFPVLVRDTTAPTLSLPDDITMEATGPDGETVSWEVAADDVVDGQVGVGCDPRAGSTFRLGTVVVECSATDAAGNRADGSFAVTVQDTTAPGLVLPDDITATAGSVDGAVVTYSTHADDIVSGRLPVTCEPASGTMFAPGSTAVSCTATDAAGNTASGTFAVTVSFDFGGFLRPVQDGVNSVKGGSTVPLKWRVSDGAGGSISALDIVRSVDQRKVSCVSGDGGEEVPATATGGTALRYGDGQFVYNWQSARQPGSCYAVTVRLTDGASHTALFSLR